MNKFKKSSLIFGVVASIIAAVNIFPISRGVRLHCYSGASDFYTKEIVVGLPFGYFVTPGTHANCNTAGNEVDQYMGQQLIPASLFFNILLWGAILMGIRMLLESGEKAVRT